MNRREFLAASGFAGVSLLTLRLGTGVAQAQQNDVIRILLEDGPNTFDPAGTGYSSATPNLTWNVYDRLVTFGSKPLDGIEGALTYDYDNIVGQAAERYEVAADGKSTTFHMRPGAVFHDGSPVTAHDAKWSLDRAVSVPTAKAQLGTGSLTDPAQFVVIDDMTIRIDTPQADRFTLPNLAILFPAIFNSKLCKEKATDADPWAQEWLRNNTAAGGPYKVTRFDAGQQFILERFSEWKNGEIENQARILCQIVPVASSRRAAAQRGEADIVRNLSGRDIADFVSGGKVKVLGIPNPSSVSYIAMNSQLAPFDNVKVRQAIALATPYEQMYDAVLYKRGKPMFGGSAETTTIAWPAPSPYVTDLEKAKALLAEAGLADGFETTFSVDTGDVTLGEPIAILMQESLGKIGIKVTINKVPSSQMGTLQTEKKLSMFLAGGSAWLRSPDYFFRIFYSGKTRWNFGNFDNAEMEKLVAETRFETDTAVYETKVKRMIEIAKQEVPMVALWSPYQDTVISASLGGYTYMFHDGVEMRALSKQ